MIAVCVALALGNGSSLGAQSVASTTARRRALDEWLVAHYRGVQLWPDSGRARSVAADAPLPRVESANDGESMDTLFAVHFGTRLDMPSIRIGTRARLAASSGAMTGIVADVTARRAFRAPSRPGVDTAARGTSMRSGWAYLVLVPRRGEKSSAAVYRGWLLIDQPDSTRRRDRDRRESVRRELTPQVLINSR